MITVKSQNLTYPRMSSVSGIRWSMEREESLRLTFDLCVAIIEHDSLGQTRTYLVVLEQTPMTILKTLAMLSSLARSLLLFS